jgi:saposin
LSSFNNLFSFFVEDIDHGLKVVELDVNSVECSVCKYVVSYVDHVIQDNKTEAAIEAALEKVCTILPHALNASCVQFVITFGPQLVKLIEKYNDSVKVCDALKLCNNGTVQMTQGM